MSRTMTLLMMGLAALLSACQTVPPTNVHQPMSARPAPPPQTAYRNGAIFQAGASRPLFEDRRARYVGDTLTINLIEKTNATTKSNAKAERTHDVETTVTTLAGVPGKSFQGLGVEASNSNKFEGKGENAANNTFTGTITVTVIEVYPNGNLLVSGEKQVAIGQGQEFVRFSGVVNPASITGANTVNSTQVADARVEYKESGIAAEAQVMGWLARFFLTVLPF